MAFVSIDSAFLDVGDALKKEIFDLIKANEDDLDSRLTGVEGGASKIIVFNGEILNASSAGSATGMLFERVTTNFTITDAKLWIYTKGSLTGTLEVDVRKSSSADFTSDSSIFSTLPEIDFSTASDYDESANAVINAGSFTAGQYIRIDITSLPTGGVLGRFGLWIIGEPT